MPLLWRWDSCCEFFTYYCNRDKLYCVMYNSEPLVQLKMRSSHCSFYVKQLPARQMTETPLPMPTSTHKVYQTFLPWTLSMQRPYMIKTVIPNHIVTVTLVIHPSPTYRLIYILIVIIPTFLIIYHLNRKVTMITVADTFRIQCMLLALTIAIIVSLMAMHKIHSFAMMIMMNKPVQLTPIQP